MKQLMGWVFREARMLAAAIVLAALPLLFLQFGWEHESANDLALGRELAARDLTAFRSRFNFRANVRDVLPRALGNAARSFTSFQDSEMNLVAGFEALKRDFPGVFEIAFFTATGDLIASHSDLREFHPLLGEFGHDRVALMKGTPGPLLRNIHRYRPFLGPFLVPDEKSFIGDCAVGRCSSFSRKRGYVVIPSPPVGQPWVMVWVTVPRGSFELGCRLLLRDLEPGFQGTRAEFVDLGEGLEETRTALGSATAEFLPALLAMGEDSSSILYQGGWMWTQATLSRSQRMVICRPDEPLAEWMAKRDRVRFFLFLLFLLSAGTVRYWLAVAGRWSLRLKLMILFLYTSVVPLGLLALSAQGLLGDRQALLEKREFLEHEEIMFETVRRYQEHAGWIEALLARVLGPPLPADDSAVKCGERRVRRIIPHLKFSLCELYDGNGESRVHQVLSSAIDVARIVPILGSEIRRRMAEFNGSDQSLRDSAKDQAVRATVESVGFDVESVFAILEGNWRRLVPINMGMSTAKLLSFPMLDTKGAMRCSAQFLWGEMQMLRSDLPGILTAIGKRLDRYSIGFEMETGKFPAGFAWWPETAMISQRAEDQSTPVHIVLPKAGFRLLLSGLHSEVLGEKVIYAASTDETIRTEVHRLRVRLYLMAFLLIGFGASLGMLIGRHFLLPIDRIGKGMAAIRARDFKTRLPVESADEFGRLAGTFNTVMEGMADLEVAAIIQETFFPGQPLEGGGWSVFGVSLPASRVGGDYFDYFRLPDGRWLLVIGDITGHGVAASLGVAMAKAMVCHPGNPDAPSAVLGLMNRMVMTILKKKRMTCFLAVFDPVTGLLTASNAGHPFPFLIRGNDVEKMDVSHMILGLRNPRPFEDRTWTLQAGDCVCFYTDGIFESPTVQGDLIGVERLRAALPGLRRNDARGTSDAVRGWFESLRAPGMLADDMTILILQKEGDGESGPEQPSVGKR